MAAQVASLLRESVSHTRRVAKGLSPVELESEGLVLALHGLAGDTEELFHVQCRFTSVGPGKIHNSDVAVHLFHISQEAIHNAVRHGKATVIDITLVTDDGTGALVIRDNGTSFSPRPQLAAGMGLRTMMYRAEMVGGQLNIESTPSGGTTVTATFENHADPDHVENPADGTDSIPEKNM